MQKNMQHMIIFKLMKYQLLVILKHENPQE